MKHSIISLVTVRVESTAHVEAHVSILSRSAVNENATVLTSLCTIVNKEVSSANNLVLLYKEEIKKDLKQSLVGLLQ